MLGRIDTLLPILALVGGVLAGFMVCAAAARWVYAVTTIFKKYKGKRTSELPQRPLIWALPLVAVLHSGPWVLAIAGYLAYYVLSQPHSQLWLWVFAGIGMSPLILTIVVLNGQRLRKRLEAERAKASNAA